jgi:hypothetical protein
MYRALAGRESGTTVHITVVSPSVAVTEPSARCTKRFSSSRSTAGVTVLELRRAEMYERAFIFAMTEFQTLEGTFSDDENKNTYVNPMGDDKPVYE